MELGYVGTGYCWNWTPLELKVVELGNGDGDDENTRAPAGPKAYGRMIRLEEWDMATLRS